MPGLVVVKISREATAETRFPVSVVPDGTCPFETPNPALKRRAILAGSAGTDAQGGHCHRISLLLLISGAGDEGITITSKIKIKNGANGP